MSYILSSPSLPTGFSIINGQLIAGANAPAFSGTITIAVTDGTTTVSQTVTIDRPNSVASALAVQVLDLISDAGSDDAFEVVEIITKTIISDAGSDDAFVPLEMSTIVSDAGSDDAFVRDGVIVVNGIEFEYVFYSFQGGVTTDFANTEFISVLRPLDDAAYAPTGYFSIGCDNSAFRAALLAEVRLTLDRPQITFVSCDVGPINGVEYVEHLFRRN
jgi:hypothetical protein